MKVLYDNTLVRTLSYSLYTATGGYPKLQETQILLNSTEIFASLLFLQQSYKFVRG